MKIALLSDIHGNLSALETVAAHIDAWQPDHVIVNGDVVNRGPQPRECLALVQQRQQDGWAVLRGNHEEYVLKHTHPTPDADHTGIRASINQNSRWTYQQLAGEVEKLADLPVAVQRFAPDGSELWATHASRRGSSDGIYPFYTSQPVPAQIAPATAVFATAHIHFAYTWQVGKTLVVNSGSVGQLCFGDTRASYAQVVWQAGQWRAKIMRLTYDRTATQRAFFASGFMTETGPIAQIIFHEWRTAVPLLPPWRARYETAVLSGHITLEASVQALLRQWGMVGDA